MKLKVQQSINIELIKDRLIDLRKEIIETLGKDKISEGIYTKVKNKLDKILSELED